MGFLCFSRPQTLIPGRRIYQSQRAADSKVDIDIQLCVHGYLARDKRQPASVIVFAAQLVCIGNGTFKLFNFEVDFHDKNKSGQPSEPIIISRAPYSNEKRLREEIVEFTNKDIKVVTKSGRVKISAGLDIQGGGQTETISEQEYAYKLHYFSKGSSGTGVNDQDRRNSVWWNVKKSTNPKTGDDTGIPPNYLFAVLLTRTNNSTPFEAGIIIHAQADRVHGIKKLVKVAIYHFSAKDRKNRLSSGHSHRQRKLFGFRAGDYEARLEPVVFDPEKKLEGECQGIDRLHLGKYMKEEELMKLTKVRK